MAEAPPKPAKKTKDCPQCESKCCRSVTIEIDVPRSKKAIGEVRWFVLHKDVLVYVDHDKKWHVEFKTRCTALTENNLCTIYEERPLICRQYPKKDETCEYEENPYKRIFRTQGEVIAYFDKRKKRRKKRG
jgi:Fe-S-cluster containining protein